MCFRVCVAAFSLWVVGFVWTEEDRGKMGLKLSVGAVLRAFWAVGRVRSGCGSCAPIGGTVADENDGEGKDGVGV